MKSILFLISIVFSTVLMAQETTVRVVNFNKIKTINNLFYLDEDKVPYTGRCELFYPNGNKSKELSVRNGQYDGLTTRFYENGQKSYEANYKLGILDGPCSSWYLNGCKKLEFSYLAGEITGKYIKWNYKGHKIFEKDYAQGNQNLADKIGIYSEQDILSKREKLIQHIWGEKGWPVNRVVDSIETNITYIESGKTPYQVLYNSSGNLKQIDRYKVFLPNSFVSKVYHFRPIKSINKVFLYHAGHGTNFHVEDCKRNNNGNEPGLVIPWLLREGYDVIAFMMPLNGNDQPTIEIGHRVGQIKFPSGTVGHDLMFDYLDHPYAYFIEDMVATVNYLKKNYKFSDYYLMGLSGGGWTTTLYAAIDPRIKYSFPVAGSIPTYLRKGTSSMGDAEQGSSDEYDPEGLYTIANFEELYVLGAYGENRRQIQILNEFDNCCFSGITYLNWVDNVKATMKKLGKGEYDFYFEQDTKTHKVSKIAMDVILSSIKDHKLELLNEPPNVAVAGKEYSFKPVVKNAEDCKPGQDLLYSLVVKPSWLTVNPHSGILSGKPSQANAGDTIYSFKVVDGSGGFIIRDVKISVLPQ